MSTALSRELPDPEVEPTIKIVRAAAVLGVSPRAAYNAAERGELPTLRVGRSLRVPTAKFLHAYGFADDVGAAVA